jgi:flavodoxin
MEFRKEFSMNKVIIIYASVHHKNTEKVVKYLAPALNAQTADLTKDERPDLSAYDTVILASGIYFNSFHKSLVRYIGETSFEGKRTILFYTCGMRYKDHARSARSLLLKKSAVYLGDVYCRGYDTFGIFGKIGGIAKGHPSDSDMEHVLSGIRRLI